MNNSKEYYDQHKDDPEYKAYRSANSKAYYQKHKAERLQKRHDRYLDTEHWKWEDVEGYDGFTKNVHVHHKREAIGYTREQLIEQGQYYNCRADELICCTNEEHKRIHVEIDKFFGRGNYSEKFRKEQSERAKNVNERRWHNA